MSVSDFQVYADGEAAQPWPSTQLVVGCGQPAASQLAGKCGLGSRCSHTRMVGCSPAWLLAHLDAPPPACLPACRRDQRGHQQGSGCVGAGRLARRLPAPAQRRLSALPSPGGRPLRLLHLGAGRQPEQHRCAPAGVGALAAAAAQRSVTPAAAPLLLSAHTTSATHTSHTHSLSLSLSLRPPAAWVAIDLGYAATVGAVSVLSGPSVAAGTMARAYVLASLDEGFLGNQACGNAGMVLSGGGWSATPCNATGRCGPGWHAVARACRRLWAAGLSQGGSPIRGLWSCWHLAVTGWVGGCPGAPGGPAGARFPLTPPPLTSAASLPQSASQSVDSDPALASNSSSTRVPYGTPEPRGSLDASVRATSLDVARGSSGTLTDAAITDLSKLPPGFNDGGLRGGQHAAGLPSARESSACPSTPWPVTDQCVPAPLLGCSRVGRVRVATNDRQRKLRRGDPGASCTHSTVLHCCLRLDERCDPPPSLPFPFAGVAGSLLRDKCGGQGVHALPAVLPRCFLLTF